MRETRAYRIKKVFLFSKLGVEHRQKTGSDNAVKRVVHSESRWIYHIRDSVCRDFESRPTRETMAMAVAMAVAMAFAE